MAGNQALSDDRPGERTGASLPARGTVQLLVARGCFTVSGYVISVDLARGLGAAEYGSTG
jgi:hypothetical protein